MFTIAFGVVVVTALSESGPSLRTTQGNVMLSIASGKTFSVQCPELADGRKLACQGETVRQLDGQCKSVVPLCEGELVTLNNDAVCVPKIAGCEGAGVELDGKGGCRPKVAGCVGDLVELDNSGNCRPKTPVIDTRINVLVDSKAAKLEGTVEATVDAKTKELQAKVSASVAGLETTEDEVTKKVDAAAKKVDAALATLAKTLEDGASSVGVTLSAFSVLHKAENMNSGTTAQIEDGPVMNDDSDYFSGDGKDGTLQSRHQRDFACISAREFDGDFYMQYNTGSSRYPIAGMTSNTNNAGWTQSNNPLTSFNNMKKAAVQHDRHNLYKYSDGGGRSTLTSGMPWQNKLIVWERKGEKTTITIGSWSKDISGYLGTRKLRFVVGHHNGPATQNVIFKDMKVRYGSSKLVTTEHFWEYAGSSASHVLLSEKDCDAGMSTLTFENLNKEAGNGWQANNYMFTAQPKEGTKVTNGGTLVTKSLSKPTNFKDEVTVTLFGVNTGSSVTKASQVKISVSRNDGKDFASQTPKEVGRWGSNPKNVAFAVKVDLSKIAAGSKLRVKVELYSQDSKTTLGLVGTNVEF